MQKFPPHYIVAMHAAIAAADEIVSIYSTSFETELKKDGSPVTTADKASSVIISSFLEKTGIPIVGEERINLNYSERKNWKENWCVDPLDGTKEYIKKNGEFAVNIALIQEGQPIFGLIAEPCASRMVVGGKNYGVFLWYYKEDPNMLSAIKIENTTHITNSVTWIGSRSHPHSDASWNEYLLEQFDEINKIEKGSALKFFELAQSEAQIYPRFAPTMEWDIAAGQAILEELGGSVINIDTDLPLSYNKESLFNPYFVAKTAAYLSREKTFTSESKR